MGTGYSATKSSLPEIYEIVQNTASLYAKQRIIESLQEYFSKDATYHYVRDEWGFNKTEPVKGLPLDAGIDDSITTRIFIGSKNRQDVVQLPSITVSFEGMRSVPISFNRNKYTIFYDLIPFTDGYITKLVRLPSYMEQVGAQDLTISVEVSARSPDACSELIDLLQIYFVDLAWEDLSNSGLSTRDVSASGISIIDDRSDKIHRCTLTLNIRSEWARHIKIKNTIDHINICIEFGNLDAVPPTIAPNLTVENTLHFIDILDLP